MKHWARLDGDRVVEVISLADDLVPGKDIFVPEMADRMVECTDQVREGWIVDKGTLREPS